MELVKFRNHLLEEEIYETTILMEEASDQGGAGADAKGKLHELLVGYHLRGKKHMEKFKDKDGLSPKEAHDSLKSKVHPDEYKKIYNRAKEAADHIRHHVETHHGHSIENVHWTSKNGDIKRSTGVESTQKQDASDIVIHARDKRGKVRYHGVSLKVTDTNKKHIPVSNPGMASMHNAEHTLENHRKNILRKFPDMKGMSVKERKEHVKKYPHLVGAALKHMHAKTLNKIASDTHKHLSSMSTEDLAHHIKTHILQAHPTPLQQQGHHHLRHTTYKSSDGQNHFHGLNPHEHYASYLTDHKQLSVHKSGTSLIFKHGGKTIARQRIKFTSQSDPLSGIKSSGDPNV